MNWVCYGIYGKSVMIRIEISTIVRQYSHYAVYEILKHIETFPLFMKDIKEIKIKRCLGDYVVSEWKTDIDGTPVEWIEEDFFNKEKLEIEFRMLEGDFEDYKGRWIVSPIGQNARIIFIANLEWGIPNFEKYIGNILEEKARRSVKGMLWVIRKRLLSQGA
jgi:ribosome-associated toxin RatA of RatAB toxin-antitoxin module